MTTRRKFIATLGAATVLPLVSANAQQRRKPVVGFLNPASPANYQGEIKGFEQGLADGGFIAGQDVVVEYRWAEGQLSRLPQLAADLVGQRVDAIVPTAGIASTLAAKAATTTIPIVFAVGTDPVRQGLVSSIHRPGGNITGLTIMTTELEAKRIELLSSLAAKGTPIAALVNGNSPEAEAKVREARMASERLGARLEVHRVSGDGDFGAAFESLAGKARLVAFLSDPLFANKRTRLVELAARHRIPAVYQDRRFAEVGGLMSYGASHAEAYR